MALCWDERFWYHFQSGLESMLLLYAYTTNTTFRMPCIKQLTLGISGVIAVATALAAADCYDKHVLIDNV